MLATVGMFPEEFSVVLLKTALICVAVWLLPTPPAFALSTKHTQDVLVTGDTNSGFHLAVPRGSSSTRERLRKGNRTLPVFLSLSLKSRGSPQKKASISLLDEHTNQVTHPDEYAGKASAVGGDVPSIPLVALEQVAAHGEDSKRLPDEHTRQLEDRLKSKVATIGVAGDQLGLEVLDLGKGAMAVLLDLASGLPESDTTRAIMRNAVDATTEALRELVLKVERTAKHAIYFLRQVLKVTERPYTPRERVRRGLARIMRSGSSVMTHVRRLGSRFKRAITRRTGDDGEGLNTTQIRNPEAE